MALKLHNYPRYANAFDSARAVMFETPHGDIGADANGVDIIKGKEEGSIVKSLIASNNGGGSALLYIYSLNDDGTTIIPYGLVSVPGGAGYDPASTPPAFDILNDPAGLKGLPVDENGKQFIQLKSDETLKAVPAGTPIATGVTVFISAFARYITTL